MYNQCPLCTKDLLYKESYGAISIYNRYFSCGTLTDFKVNHYQLEINNDLNIYRDIFYPYNDYCIIRTYNYTIIYYENERRGWHKIFDVNMALPLDWFYPFSNLQRKLMLA